MEPSSQQIEMLYRETGHSLLAYFRQRTGLTEAAKLAACLAVGLLVGWTIRPVRNPPEGAPLRATSLNLASIEAPAPASKFWSTAERRIGAPRGGPS